MVRNPLRLYNFAILPQNIQTSGEPRASNGSSAFSISWISLVKSWREGRSRYTSSLKLATKTSSSGLEARTSAKLAATAEQRPIEVRPLFGGDLDDAIRLG